MISQFDDDWITEGEEHNGSSNIDLLGIIDSATRRKNRKKNESDNENFNDVEMETHGIKDDFEIHNNINLDNLRGLELNNINLCTVQIAS